MKLLWVIKLLFKYRKIQMYMNKEALYKSVKQCTCLLSYYNELSMLQLLFCEAITTIGFIKSVWNLLALALGLGPEPEESFTKGFINARLHTCTYRFVPRLHLENRTTEASRECGILQNLPCCDLSKTNVPIGKRRLFL